MARTPEEQEYITRMLESAWEHSYDEGYREGRRDGYKAGYNHALIFLWLAHLPSSETYPPPAPH
jgi:flagellar biosynthesis/type III secretory pathway protein FliH